MATSPLLILIGLFFLLPSSALCPGPGLAGLPVVAGSSLIFGGFGGFGRPARCSRLVSYLGFYGFSWFFSVFLCFLVFLKICFLFLALGAWPHRLFLNLGPFLGFVLGFLWFSLVVLGFGPWAWGLAWCFGARFWLVLFLFALVLTWFKLCMVPCH